MRALVVLIAFCFFAALAVKFAEPAKQPVRTVAIAKSDSPFLQAEAAAPAQARALLKQAAVLSRPDPAPAPKIQNAEPATIQVPKQPPPPPDSETPCTDLLAEDIAVMQLTSSSSGISGNELCGDEAPARLNGIKLRDGSIVQVTPAVMAKCEMAHEFARWVRDDLAEAARFAGSGLRRIHIDGSYTCRPVNNIKGQRLSEHGKANAVDIGSVTLANGKTFAIFSPEAPGILLASMRASACARFTTVLGPGADEAHRDHIHIDLAQRRGGYKICQWTMPNWPLP